MGVKPGRENSICRRPSRRNIKPQEDYALSLSTQIEMCTLSLSLSDESHTIAPITPITVDLIPTDISPIDLTIYRHPPAGVLQADVLETSQPMGQVDAL